MQKLSLTALLIAISASSTQEPVLKDVFKDRFLIGVAINQSQFTERNAAEADLIKRQFNSITPENILKWEEVQPELTRYNFVPADSYVAFGEKNGMFIVGHNLVWHSQTPKWVFEASTREALLDRMHDHIRTVVGRYKGRIKGWDVVNEALNDDGTLRKSQWQKIIGDDYIEKAFQFAHEADPDAELYYNDYSLENKAKREGAIALVKKLQTAGIPISGIGTQTHIHLQYPDLQQIDDELTELGQLGIKVMVTELDINVLPSVTHSADVSVHAALDPASNPYPNGLPEDMQQKLADRYSALFKIFEKHSDVLKRVTFWGATDADSWLNNWPVRGRTNYPLLFDRDGKPKLAFSRVIETQSLH